MDSSFGNWIKRRRKALDLTQKELAQRVGCSLATIVKIEADERRPSRQVAELLTEHLQIPVDQRDLFLKVARQQKAVTQLEPVPPLPEVVTASAAQPIPKTLPTPLTSFVGREHEMEAILRQLEDPACRLLTLTGPGGVGKSRLAVEVAHRSQASFAHGSLFVPLAGTATADVVVQAVAASLGLTFTGAVEVKVQLLNFLREKHILLVLDNLEQLLHVIDMLDELLGAAPHIKILATSREQLNLRSEWVFEVQGLPVPTGTGAQYLEGSSAATLFMQRARQVKADFKASSEDLQAIVRICQLVEGLPLALELAATWVNTLTCTEIAAEIEQNLSFLATSRRDMPERHRSINAIFDYSWELLSTQEQEVFRKLSVFRGGFVREAGAQVAGTTLPLLSSLVGKSLVRRSGSGRYDQHELVRQYAAMRLREDPETERSTQDAFASYYLGLWQERENQLKGAGQREAVQELIQDIDNFRSAWELAVRRGQFRLLYPALRTLLLVYDMLGWHVNAIKSLGMLIEALASSPDAQGDHSRLYGMAIALQGWFYFRHGLFKEARERFEQGLAVVRQLDDPRDLADVLILFSPLMNSLGEADKALRYGEEGLAAARASRDDWRIAHGRMMQGGILIGRGQFERAFESSLEALTLFRRLKDWRLIVVTLNTLGYVALQSSRYREARQFLDESLSLIDAAQDPWSTATAYGNLGILELRQGNPAVAKEYLERSIPLLIDQGMLGDLASSTTYLGEAALLLGDVEGAERHWRTAIRIASKIEGLPTVLAALVRMAELRADQGEISRALRWAAFVAGHPAAWQDSKARAERLIREAGSLLPSDQPGDPSTSLEEVIEESLDLSRGS